jgi:hypothetical protein
LQEADITGETSTDPFLPEDIIECILDKLCPVSGLLVPLLKLNKRYNKTIKQILQENPELPSLLLPSSQELIFHSTTACDWDEFRGLEVPCEWQKLNVPDFVKKGRFCGSSDGDWLVLQNPDDVLFFNISTGQPIKLPTTIDLSHQYQQYPTIEVKAAVASWISSTEIKTVAAIVDTTLTGDTIALWRDKRVHWEQVVCPNSDNDPLQDVILFKNHFYFLTLRMLGTVVPEIEDDGSIWGNWEDVQMKEMKELDDFHPMAKIGNFLTQRYLIESKGELYCVSKLLDVDKGFERKLKFTVCRLTKDNQPLEELEHSSSDEDDEEEYNQGLLQDEEEEEEEEEPPFLIEGEEDEKEEDSHLIEGEEDVPEADEPEEEEPEEEVEEEEPEEEEEEPEDEDEADDQESMSEEEEDEASLPLIEIAEEEDKEEEEEEKPELWMWMDACELLDDRVFFIGRAASRSFPSSTEEGRIYFFDDSCVQPERGPPGEFLRDKMGFISMYVAMEYDSPTIRPLVGDPPLPRLTSDKSSPTWWFH